MVETHFIEHFKSDLFPDRLPEETNAAAKLCATVVAACICELEHNTSRKFVPSMLNFSFLRLLLCHRGSFYLI